jgi:hypothetical protein
MLMSLMDFSIFYLYFRGKLSGINKSLIEYLFELNAKAEANV